jgi:hypothetical protein
LVAVAVLTKHICLFGIMVAVAAQSAFHLKMLQNNIFLFF